MSHFTLILSPPKQLQKYSCMCVWEKESTHSCCSASSLPALRVWVISLFFYQGICRVCIISLSLEDGRGFYKPVAFRTSSFKHYSRWQVSFGFVDLSTSKWSRDSVAYSFLILPCDCFIALLAMIVLNILWPLSFLLKIRISTIKHFNLLTISYLLFFLFFFLLLLLVHIINIITINNKIVQ